MLLGTLGASLLGIMLTGKGILSIDFQFKEEKGILRDTDHGNKTINSTPSFNKLWNAEVLSE